MIAHPDSVDPTLLLVHQEQAEAVARRETGRQASSQMPSVRLEQPGTAFAAMCTSLGISRGLGRKGSGMSEEEEGRGTAVILQRLALPMVRKTDPPIHRPQRDTAVPLLIS